MKHRCPGWGRMRTLDWSWGPRFMPSYRYVGFHWGRKYYAAWLLNDPGVWCKKHKGGKS